MRLIKLSQADKNMRTRADVLSFFNRVLRRKSRLGEFGLTKGKSNMAGIHRGTLLIFSYKMECMFIARAASEIIPDSNPEFPAYFVIDVDSIAKVKSSLHEYEQALKKKGLLKKTLVRGQAWPELSEECEAFTLNYFKKPPLTDEPELPSPEFEKKVRRLRQNGVSVRPQGQASPERVEVTTVQLKRDPKVKAWVLESAQGKCGLCGKSSPFNDDYGDPFLEVHHVRFLGAGGSDKISNAVALCPNCHRACHLSSERAQHLSSLYERLGRLIRE